MKPAELIGTVRLMGMPGGQGRRGPKQDGAAAPDQDPGPDRDGGSDP